MATYTLVNVTFNAAQEAGLDRKLFLRNAPTVAENTRRAALTPPGTPLPLQTKQQYLDSLVAVWPAQFVTEFRNDFRERCGTAMQAASVANLQTIATTLGIDINPYD